MPGCPCCRFQDNRLNGRPFDQFIRWIIRPSDQVMVSFDQANPIPPSKHPDNPNSLSKHLTTSQPLDKPKATAVLKGNCNQRESTAFAGDLFSHKPIFPCSSRWMKPTRPSFLESPFAAFLRSRKIWQGLGARIFPRRTNSGAWFACPICGFTDPAEKECNHFWNPPLKHPKFIFTTHKQSASGFDPICLLRLMSPAKAISGERNPKKTAPRRRRPAEGVGPSAAASGRLPRLLEARDLLDGLGLRDGLLNPLLSAGTQLARRPLSSLETARLGSARRSSAAF